MGIRRWRATMPKDAPPEGKSHFVFAVKMASGERVEYTGATLTGDLMKVLRTLQESAIAAKEPR